MTGSQAMNQAPTRAQRLAALLAQLAAKEKAIALTDQQLQQAQGDLAALESEHSPN